MAATNWPTELPLDEITNLISIVRAGTISANRPSFYKSAWVVAGYLLAKRFDDSPKAVEELPGNIIAAMAKPFDSDSAVTVLESIADNKTESISPIVLSFLLQWLIGRLSR